MKKIILVLALFTAFYSKGQTANDSITKKLHQLDSAVREMNSTLKLTKYELKEFNKHYYNGVKVALTSPIPFLFGQIFRAGEKSNIENLKLDQAKTKAGTTEYNNIQKQIDDAEKSRRNTLTGTLIVSGVWNLIGTIMIIDAHKYIGLAGLEYTRDGIVYKF